MPQLTWSVLCELEKIGRQLHSPMNCSDIGDSYEAFTHLFASNVSHCLLSANRNPSADILFNYREYSGTQSTLQEFKLQGTKIREGVVLS